MIRSKTAELRRRAIRNLSRSRAKSSTVTKSLAETVAARATVAGHGEGPGGLLILSWRALRECALDFCGEGGEMVR